MQRFDPRVQITFTRTILLHVLRAHLEARAQQPASGANIPASALALSNSDTKKSVPG
jgi:hypothetical protein